MPTIDYTCPCCGHGFRRVILRGEPPQSATCPRCKTSEIPPVRGPAGLFDGPTPFSRLADDTN